ncbi:hypothetical protein MRX96_056748 [Rhipicephalus microplus]
MIFTYAQTAGKVNQKVTCAIDNIELHDCVGTTTPKERKCDFEDGWCTWKNNNTSNNHLAWMLGGEYFKTTLLRPNHDHTYGNGTEVLFSSDSRTQCVEFWYDINGDKDTTLQVLAVDTTDQSRKASLLWTQKGSDKSSWLMGQLAPPQYSRLVFRGAVGPASQQAYIALDDISIHGNDRCEMLPQGAEDLDEGELLGCDFDTGSLCHWTSKSTSGAATWVFGTPVNSSLGPLQSPEEKGWSHP